MNYSKGIIAIAAVVSALGLMVNTVKADPAHHAGRSETTPQMPQADTPPPSRGMPQRPTTGPGMMGQGMGQGTMGQGMGPGTMGQGMGPGMMGQGTGPGMMGQGMGPGTMGQGMGPGMMGQGMGPGMMGPGMMGQGMGCAGSGGDRDLSAAQVKDIIEGQIAWGGNERLKVGKVEKKDEATYVAEIVTVDDSLVQKLEVDRNTGAMRPVK